MTQQEPTDWRWVPGRAAARFRRVFRLPRYVAHHDPGHGWFVEWRRRKQSRADILAQAAEAGAWEWRSWRD